MTNRDEMREAFERLDKSKVVDEQYIRKANGDYAFWSHQLSWVKFQLIWQAAIASMGDVVRKSEVEELIGIMTELNGSYEPFNDACDDLLALSENAVAKFTKLTQPEKSK